MSVSIVLFSHVGVFFVDDGNGYMTTGIAAYPGVLDGKSGVLDA